MPSVPSDDPSSAQNRRQPTGQPDMAHAYAQLVASSDLTPEQHFDDLLGALLEAHPQASVLDVCAWVDPGILRRELGSDADLGDGGITLRTSHGKK